MYYSQIVSKIRTGEYLTIPRIRTIFGFVFTPITFHHFWKISFDHSALVEKILITCCRTILFQFFLVLPKPLCLICIMYTTISHTIQSSIKCIKCSKALTNFFLSFTTKSTDYNNSFFGRVLRIFTFALSEFSETKILNLLGNICKWLKTTIIIFTPNDTI